MKLYCLGFAFSADGQEVLLIEKRRPHFQAGLLNGIGGSVEAGETPDQAMVREAQEEAGLRCDWRACGSFGDEGTYRVMVYQATADLSLAIAGTDEPLRRMPWALLTEDQAVPGVVEMIKEITCRQGSSSAGRAPP